MILKFSGECYGYTDKKHEVLVNTEESFSTEHDDYMTTIYQSEGYLVLKRESFICEVGSQ